MTRAFLAALMFLTRIPVPRWVGHEPELLARSTTYFPLVGLIVGAWGGTVFWVVSLGWSPVVAAASSTMATVWLTGAFHEDALADSLDGFGGGWERDDILAIMKDSRVGSYALVGVALALAAKIGALVSIAGANGTVGVLRALVAAHVLARWSSLPLIRRYPYVRDTAAKSRPFASSVTTARLTTGTLLTLAGVVLALWGQGVRTAASLAVAAVVTALAGRYFQRRIDGITGDCLGAANQLVELAVYFTLAFHPAGRG